MRVCKNCLVFKSTETTGNPSSQVCLYIILLLYNIKLLWSSGFMSVLLLLCAVSFGSIFFLFPIEVARGQFCSSHGNLMRALGVVCFVLATAILESK